MIKPNPNESPARPHSGGELQGFINVGKYILPFDFTSANGFHIDIIIAQKNFS